MRGGPSGTPPLDSYCPFGAIESAYLYITSGQFLHRVGFSNLIVFFALIFMGIVLKSGFCGWICPFGTVQEWIRKLGIKVLGERKYISDKLDRRARYLKYVVLLLIMIATILTGKMVFRNWDPFVALFHFGAGDIKWTAYSVLLAVIIGSFFIMRFWCRYFCPLGLIVGLVGKLGIYKIECRNETCTSCRSCERLCPMNVQIAKQGRISSVECISCLDCLAVMDFHDSLELKKPGANKRLNPALYPVLLFLFFFGTIGAAQAMGIWKTGKGFKRFFSTVDSAGKQSVSRLKIDTREEEEKTVNVHGREIEIRGNMSLQTIEQLTSVPARYIIASLGLPQYVPRYQTLGKLRKIYNFTIQDVRKSLRTYLEAYKVLEEENNR